MITKKLRWRVLAVFAVFALALGACSDSEEATDTTTADGTATTEATETTETTEATETAETTMAGLSVVSDTQFTVTLSAPESFFPIRLVYPAYSPLPEAFFADPDGFNEMPIGQGPFMIAEPWDHNVAIHTTAYPDYAGDEPAQIENLEFRIFDDVNTALNELLAGNLDIHDSVPPERVAELEGQVPNMDAQATSSINYLGIPWYDPDLGGDENRDLRAALSMAIDQEAITTAIFDGRRLPAFNLLSPVIPSYQDQVCDAWGYDPEAAAALYATTDGIPSDLTFYFNAGAGHEAWIEAVTNQWAQNLGIDVSGIKFEGVQPFGDYLLRLDEQAVDGPFRLGWGMDYPHPQNYWQLLLDSRYHSNAGGANSSFYVNPAFDAKVDEALAINDLNESLPVWQEVAEIACNDVPVIPMFYGQADYAWNDTVNGVRVDSFSNVVYTELTPGESGSVSTYIGEPESLITTNDTESEGIAVLRALYTPLVNIDENNEPVMAAAESVETTDGGTTWVITIKDGWTFHDGTPVTAQSYVDAWNYGAYGPNAQQNSGFFSQILGFDDLQCGTVTEKDEDGNDVVVADCENQPPGSE